ncbi:hypothetical protein [Mesorhizobium sp.]|uniref:hypothetical protein n=1 Tax=Mesorhizobium sp. TaxID=1871066 RepID=UPI0025C484DB|nr:hypothetical protein [Mesorhizobium sp.]
MGDLEEGQRLDFRAAVAEHGGKGGIGLQDAAVETDDGDADRRVFHSPAEALLALGDLTAVVGDLPDEHCREKHRACRHGNRELEAEFQRLGAKFQPRRQDGSGRGDHAGRHQPRRGIPFRPKSLPVQPPHNAFHPCVCTFR